MRIAFDPETDSLYIHLSERPGVNSDEVSDGVVCDFDVDGILVGIDVQHARSRADLSQLKLSKLPVVELAT